MKILTLILSILFVGVNARVVCKTAEDKLIDLTHPYEETDQGYPGLKPFELKINYRGTTKDGYWLQTEDYSSAIHVGTHMDAPCHIERGQWTLEDIPLSRFMAPAAVVDITSRTSRDSDANLEIEDLKEWEKVANASLDGTIVLVNTGWSRKWKNKKGFLGTDTGDVSKLHFPGVSPAAAEWIAQNRNIYGLGIDTTSLDNGQAKQRKAHQGLFRANIYGMENVAQIHMLPAYGAQVFVLPMRIKKACGAPVRIIAQIPEGVKERTPSPN